LVAQEAVANQGPIFDVLSHVAFKYGFWRDAGHRFRPVADRRAFGRRDGSETCEGSVRRRWGGRRDDRADAILRRSGLKGDTKWTT